MHRCSPTKACSSASKTISEPHGSNGGHRTKPAWSSPSAPQYRMFSGHVEASCSRQSQPMAADYAILPSRLPEIAAAEQIIAVLTALARKNTTTKPPPSMNSTHTGLDASNRELKLLIARVGNQECCTEARCGIHSLFNKHSRDRKHAGSRGSRPHFGGDAPLCFLSSLCFLSPFKSTRVTTEPISDTHRFKVPNPDAFLSASTHCNGLLLCRAGTNHTTSVLRSSVCINLVQKPAHQPVVPEKLTFASKQQKCRRLQRARSKEGQLQPLDNTTAVPPQPDELEMGCRSQSPGQKCRKGFSRSTKAVNGEKYLGENIFLSEETSSLATPEDAASKQSTSEACRNTRSSWKQKEIPHCDRTLLTMALVSRFG